MVHAEAEIKDYMEEVKEFVEKKQRPVDKMTWWKDNSREYPVLFQLAQLVLWQPSSTACVERLFSLCGRLNRPARNQLAQEIFEYMVLLKCPLPAMEPMPNSVVSIE